MIFVKTSNNVVNDTIKDDTDIKNSVAIYYFICVYLCLLKI